jgi:hypothetical protein
VTLVTYHRSGGFPPPDDERLTVDDDGTYTLVRTNGAPRVGQFAGRIAATERDALRDLAEAAAAAGGHTGLGVPDAAWEDVLVGSTRATFAGPPPEGPWGALVTALRRLLNDLAGPGGTGLTLKVGRTSARLLVSGDAPQEVDLGHLGGEAVTFTAAGALGDRAGLQTSVVRGQEQWTELTPGQPVDFAYAAPLAVEPGGRLQVEVRLPGRRDGAAVLYRLLAVWTATPE